MKIKLIIFAVVAIFFSCNKGAGNKKELLKKIESLELKLDKTYKPGFGELMSGIQNHHAKLWFAGINENWKLAEFEVHEIKEILGDVGIYQNDRGESKYLDMMNPSIEKISKTINSNNINNFKKDYIQLTKTCNDCHEKTKYEYIKIVVPQKNNFSNQEY